jgi:hypothetical protein
VSYEIVTGDLGSMPLSITLNDASVDTSTADTVEFHWVMPDGTLRVSELTPVDPTVGAYLMEWESGDTDQIGPHFGHVVVTEDDIEQTYPSDGSRVIWFINPSIDEYE